MKKVEVFLVQFVSRWGDGKPQLRIYRGREGAEAAIARWFGPNGEAGYCTLVEGEAWLTDEAAAAFETHVENLDRPERLR